MFRCNNLDQFISQTKLNKKFKVVLAVLGFLIFLGGLGIVSGIFVKASVILIAVFLLITSFTVHNFWSVADPHLRMFHMINFFTNMALLGGNLMFLSIPEPWAYSIIIG
ncbi:MAG: hypothetical protein US50_C0015G0007 [Candidatus Nomurabacteria bacterium GW2011_GWB1_37_5]|uniref:Uncharacterized protein n=1 Tax=Candidatus Nomurabacteria bacterium GW2011_GWB1_37_5 TaxID=1618742 RepID=A0A0G0HA48_9BACT|nr:MAG: hypothetical protein US50_C0015G0007 [Candidatus Nomurabacteria bacterium GW2011_GWB1_37_5]